MKTLKLFDLIERSFLSLKKTNKKIWIIAIIISIFSGGLIIQESFESDSYSDLIYQDEIYDETYEEVEEVEEVDTVFTETFEIITTVILILVLIFILAIFSVGLLINVVTYYLYRSIYEATYDTKLDKASLGLIVKVNLIVFLKILLGFVLFIIPGIIASIKYSPVNYVLCNNPELSSKEILKKTQELSKGFRWKIFIFNTFITIIGLIITFVCSLSIFVQGYVGIAILDMMIKFVLTTFTVVYSGIFNIHLYREIENIKEMTLS